MGGAPGGPLPSNSDQISRLTINKLESIFAQQFRNAVNPMPVALLYNDEAKDYILDRLRKVHITCRPQHLMAAYESAVAVRVLAPQVFHNLHPQSKSFYSRLSERYIKSRPREPSPLLWDVSDKLSELEMMHRNTFQWGPFPMDIALEDSQGNGRRDCIFVDSPTSFYLSTNQYLPRKKLRHHLLTSLGWNVRRVRWDEWLSLEPDKRVEWLRVLMSSPAPTELLDVELAPVKEQLTEFMRFKAIVKQQRYQDRYEPETMDLGL
uniref:RAP domain-containing protein n=1 Tax=Oxyrrhis marina TaxID=2969 RepID=A0A7S4GPA6_OXYMA